MILIMYKKEGRDIYPNIKNWLFLFLSYVPIFFLYAFLCYRNFL